MTPSMTPAVTNGMNELTLLIQASNGVPVLALACRNQTCDTVVFDSSKVEAFVGSRDYRLMLETGLETLGATLAEITRIGCDIGPGGLGVTRTAAAFANGLGFALGVSVYALPAFELLGAELGREPEKPVAILRRAARPHVHFGVYRNGQLVNYEHCLQDDAFKQLETLDNYDLAGNVPMDGREPPKTNVAQMQTMLAVLNRTPVPPENARALPIVEVLE